MHRSNRNSTPPKAFRHGPLIYCIAILNKSENLIEAHLCYGENDVLKYVAPKYKIISIVGMDIYGNTSRYVAEYKDGELSLQRIPIAASVTTHLNEEERSGAY